MAAAAYVLVSHVRRVGLAGTPQAAATVNTIRLVLFKVGAWVQRTARRWVVRMASGYPWADLFATDCLHSTEAFAAGGRRSISVSA